MVSYRVMLDVPRELILFVSGLLAAHRREIGTRRGTRRLGCYRQALFGLAWFRDKGDIRRLGAGFGLPQSTAYRYLDEVIEVLAARAPGLADALQRALAGLGVDAVELDLREYFGQEQRLRRDLAWVSLAWLRGGHVFMFCLLYTSDAADE